MLVKRSFLFLCLFFSLSYCHKKDNAVVPESQEGTIGKEGTLEIHLQNLINGEKIAFNNANYTNINGDTFKISSLRYYLSNIKLKSSKGIYKVPESYYFVDVSKEQNSILTIPKVPADSYNEIQFSIGVDSIRNHTGAQVGALDPANDMIWSWSTGYKFISLAGQFKNNKGTYQPLAFDIAEDQNYKTFTFNNKASHWADLPITSETMLPFYIQLEFSELFKTPTTISFDKLSSVQAGPSMSIISKNYEDMCQLPKN